MIVEQYLEWAATAPKHMRAEAAGALARSYIHGDLEPEICAQIATVLTRTLDDDSLAVRCAVAEALATSEAAPHSIVLALAQDAADVAEPLLLRSPVLTDHELVDIAATGGRRAQLAIARRIHLSENLAAAIAEVASAEACEALVRNRGARLGDPAAARIARRHGENGAVRDALIARGDLGPEIRQILMRSVADALSSFVSGCGWLGAERARRVANEACERGAVAIASDAADARSFIMHLARRDELSPSLALRALLSGEFALFEAALSTLSGQSPKRVSGFVREPDGRGFALLYAEAGLPAAALPAFRAALAAARETGFAATAVGAATLSLRMVERALVACGDDSEQIAPLKSLLRRFATEAAREQARIDCARAQAEISARLAPQLDLASLEEELRGFTRIEARLDLSAIEAEIAEIGVSKAA